MFKLVTFFALLALAVASPVFVANPVTYSATVATPIASYGTVAPVAPVVPVASYSSVVPVFKTYSAPIVSNVVPAYRSVYW